MGNFLGPPNERGCLGKSRGDLTRDMPAVFSPVTMDVRDEYGKWALGEVTPMKGTKSKVHIRFVGWESKWDLRLDTVRDNDRFAEAGKYTSDRGKPKFQQSDYVLILRRKPSEAKRKWIKGFVRMVDGPQLQVQYTYGGVTFQYWYHYHQPEIHSLKDSNRWLNLKPADRMEDLPDGVSGLFGKEIMDILFSREARSLKRVGAHADGSCFFHAVFHSLNAKDPMITTSGAKPTEDDDADARLSYRQLTQKQRSVRGQKWRQSLACLVEKKWFDENLSNVCDWKTYIEQYRSVAYSTGPTHNMHVASFFKVNIFFVSFYTHPTTKKRDFFVRISSPDGAAQYNLNKPSIILFHRALGERGHYESVQTDERDKEYGQGIFDHEDPIIKHLLTKANNFL
mmetsp:Transcript_19717/g.29457  ORF Transcript_19717/g.29457 Transcript_19717/m.29457 type:complete len:396 (-) Transcript_19717:194-1381(-)